MYNNTRMSRGVHKSGTLPSNTPVVINMSEAPLPATITLKSSDAGRLIELCTDGGVEYFTPVVDVTSGTMQIVAVSTPVTNVKFTGANADTWSVI